MPNSFTKSLETSPLSEPPQEPHELIYFISGMWCSTCAKNIRESVLKIPGIQNVNLSYASKLLIVTLSSTSLDTTLLSTRPSDINHLDLTIKKEVTRIGFGIKRQSGKWISTFHETLKSESQNKIPWTQISLVWFLAMWSSMIAFSGYLGGNVSGQEHFYISLASSAFGLPAILLGAIPFGRAGLRALWFSKLLTLDFFIFVGGCSAFSISIISLLTGSSTTYADSGSMILAILLLTKKIETTIVSSTTSQILYQLKTGHSQVEVFKREEWKKAEPSQIRKKDLVRYAPEDVISHDGILKDEKAFINNHLMSGESHLIELKKGDLVFAGAIVKNPKGSPLTLEVTSPEGERKIDTWAEKAILGGSKQSQFTDLLMKIESSLVLIAFLGALVLMGLQILKGGSPQNIAEAFFIGILIFCPCLFASILPLTKQLSNLALLKSGVVSYRPDALLDLSKIKNFYFDKTGTLEAISSSFISFKKENEERFFSYLKLISEKSSHPLLRELELPLQNPESIKVSQDISSSFSENNMAPKSKIQGDPLESKNKEETLSLKADLPNPASKAFLQKNSLEILSFNEFPGEGSLSLFNDFCQVLIGKPSFLEKNGFNISKFYKDQTLIGIGKCSIPLKQAHFSQERVSGTDSIEDLSQASHKNILKNPLGDSLDEIPIQAHDGQIVGEILSQKSYNKRAIDFLKELSQKVPKAHIGILSGDPKSQEDNALLNDSLLAINYQGNLSPEEKADFVLPNSVFVGDGLNDTLALSKAQASFRIGHRISGLSPVDFELRTTDLNLVLKTILYSKKFKKILIQTGMAALIYNAIAFTLAGFGLFSPLGAVVAMLSSFSIMLLSVFRLKRV